MLWYQLAQTGNGGRDGVGGGKKALYVFTLMAYFIMALYKLYAILIPLWILITLHYIFTI